MSPRRDGATEGAPATTPLGRLVPLLEAAAVLALARWPRARAVLPVLGVFTGPLGAVLAALAAAVALLRGRRRPPLPSPPGWLLFVLATLLSSVVGLHYARAVEPSGDEIDYLLMAQSLWREGDLDLRDNFRRGDYLEYLGGYDRMPGGARRADGRPYPTHSPGLSALLAPAYAAGGRQACVLVLALLAAGLGLLVRDLALRAGASEEAALLAWATAIGPPVLFYTAFLYTEVPVAFALALALRLLLAPPGPAGAAVAALSLSALPWLHVRMALAAAALGLFALAVLRGRARLSFALTGFAMAAAWVGYHYWVFHSFSPFARYGGRPPGPMVRATPLKTLVGLFVDGAYGLLPYAPAFVLALAGLPYLARQERPVRWGLSLAGLAVLLPVLGWRNWWGFSPPARFMVPLVPVLAVALALRLGRAAPRGLARWRFALLLAGFGLALLMFAAPRAMRMINPRGGPSNVQEMLRGEESLSRYLPYLGSREGSVEPPWNPPPSEPRVAGLWVLALVALLALDRLALRSERVDRWFRGLGLPLAFLLAIALAVDRWARPGGL